MSIVAIRKAIETALSTITPVIETAYENDRFTPTVNVPYQYVSFPGFFPDSPEITKSHRLIGFCQIDLFYPLLTTTKLINERAELIKDKFKKASTFTSGTINVNITNTPEVLTGRNEGDRWKVSVRIDYSAWVIVN